MSPNGDTDVFPDIDRAIECAENSLLYAQPQLHPVEIPLAEIDLLAKFNSMDLARSATVVADQDLVCFVLTMSKFSALMENHPSVAMRILAAIGRELSRRLRTANRTIHQLET